MLEQELVPNESGIAVLYGRANTVPTWFGVIVLHSKGGARTVPTYSVVVLYSQ